MGAAGAPDADVPLWRGPRDVSGAVRGVSGSGASLERSEASLERSGRLWSGPRGVSGSGAPLERSGASPEGAGTRTPAGRRVGSRQQWQSGHDGADTRGDGRVDREAAVAVRGLLSAAGRGGLFVQFTAVPW